MRIDFDQHALCRVDEDLQKSSFVEWGVEKREQTLLQTDDPIKERKKDGNFDLGTPDE